MKDAVLPQELCGLDPFVSEDHRIEHGQKHLANSVTIVALHEPDVLLQGVFEADAGEKPREKVYATRVCQCLRTKRNTERTGSFGYSAESELRTNRWGSVQTHHVKYIRVPGSVQYRAINPSRMIQVEGNSVRAELVEALRAKGV